MIVRDERIPRSARFAPSPYHANESFPDEIPSHQSFARSQAELADQLRAQIIRNCESSPEYSDDLSEFHAKMQRQSAYALSLRKSIENHRSGNTATFESVSGQADMLIRSLHERSEKAKSCDAVPVILSPINYVPGSLYKPRKAKVPLVVSPTAALSAEEAPPREETESPPTPQPQPQPPTLRLGDVRITGRRICALGQTPRPTEVRLNTASEMVYPDGHCSPAKGKRSRYDQRLVQY